MKAKISYYEDEDGAKEPILHITPDDMNEAISLGMFFKETGGGLKKSMTNSSPPELELNIIDMIERVIA